MIKINSVLDKFRHNIYNVFFPFLNKDEGEIDYDELTSKIDMIREYDNYYRTFVTILFLDDYRLKFRYLINNQATDGDKESLDYYDNNIKSVDDIIDYLDNGGDIIDMLNSTLVFTNLKSNYQREVLTCSWMKNKYLKSVSPFHILDLFYYSFPVSLDDFIELFNEYNDEENSLDASGEATVEFSKTLTDLFESDENNYKTLVDGLVESYKIMKYHRIFQDEELDELMKKDNLDIYNTIYSNSHIRIKILDYFLEYSILCSDEEREMYKEEYNKVIKKKR